MKGDTGNRLGWQVVGQHELRTAPAAAKGFTLARLTLVGIVATEAAVADE
jgi:hypothetical protein